MEEKQGLKKVALMGGACAVLLFSYFLQLRRNEKNRKVYFEKQEQDNSCFTHALNMFFQRETFPNSFAEYKKRVLEMEEEVIKTKEECGKRPFYGDKEVPEDEKLREESSRIEENYDLKGYFEVSAFHFFFLRLVFINFKIYSFSGPSTILENIEETNVKELSPYEALFLLQFQGRASKDGKQIESLEFVPHKILHRYPRVSLEEQRESKKRFQEEIAKVDKAFFCHLEKKSSHAFAAIRDTENEKQWFLLDSLRNGFLKVPEERLFEEERFAGRASVMIVRDNSAKSRVLWTKNKTEN